VDVDETSWRDECYINSVKLLQELILHMKFLIVTHWTSITSYTQRYLSDDFDFIKMNTNLYIQQLVFYLKIWNSLLPKSWITKSCVVDRSADWCTQHENELRNLCLNAIDETIKWIIWSNESIRISKCTDVLNLQIPNNRNTYLLLHIDNKHKPQSFNVLSLPIWNSKHIWQFSASWTFTQVTLKRRTKNYWSTFCVQS
jgi:hypothetical protein